MSQAPGVSELFQRFVNFTFCRADLLFELDENLNIVFSAGTIVKLIGMTDQQLIGLSFLDFIDIEDRDLIDELLSVKEKDARLDDIAVSMLMKNNISIPVAIAGYRAPNFKNHFFLAVKVRPRSLQKPVHHTSFKDPETGILNEKAFPNSAASTIHSYSDAGGTAKFSMVKFDNAEDLKKLVPEKQTSEMMAAVGEILGNNSLGGNAAGRIDEYNFGFVHSENISAEDVALQIKQVTSPMLPAGVELKTSSVTMDADSETMNEDEISKALIYAIKKSNSNSTQETPKKLSTILEKLVDETMRMVKAFKKVCKTEHFDLTYMPVCELDTGAIHHFEALTRFRGGKENDSPYELITLAEEVGIISEFDLVVMSKAIKYVQAASKNSDFFPVAVNISGHSISNMDFVSHLHNMIDITPGLSEILMFEITESAKILDLDVVNSTIQSFRKKGFKVALDDFGAGAAGFDYLSTFEVDTVKFDGPVVKRAYSTHRGKAFLVSMATLCRDMGIETIAEMVEDFELAEFLLKSGVDLGQGYYYGQPNKVMASFSARLPERRSDSSAAR